MEQDLNEERRKKLEAGKERLAAFRKKKAKKKKVDCEKPAATKEIIEPLNGGVLSPPQFPSWNDVLQEDSDQYFVSSGDDFSSEEPESRSSIYYQAKLADAKQRISELEETVEGKQLALDSMTRQYELNEAQKTSSSDNLNCNANGSNDFTHSDLGKALAQRDAIIAQLTETLQTTNAVEMPAESDMLTQIQSLSQQVCLLQNQLQENDQAMQEEAKLRDISSSTLQAAKGQMLQLQTIVNDKDNALRSVSEQLETSQGCLQRLQNEKQDLINELSTKSRAVSDLSQKLENLKHLENVSSHWHEQEKGLQDELMSKSEEIKVYVEAGRRNEAVIGELRSDNQAKDERLQVLQEELEELKELKADMENKSQELKKENEELTAYHQNVSASLSDNNALAAELDQSKQALADLTAQHESLKSKCLLLDSVVDELKQENASSKSQLEDLKQQLEAEHQKHEENEKKWFEMESQQRTYSDQLNNKLNDLQNKLSTSDEILNNERQELIDLQSQHEELLSQIQSKDEMIADLGNLQLEFQNLSDKLQSKEGDFERLKEEMLSKSLELEKQLEEMKTENEMLSELAIKLKDDLSSAQHVHGVEMSERDYRENNFEAHLELMNEELDTVKKRSAELENKVKDKETDLVTECEKREAIEKQLAVLESERDTLRETVQSLNADIGQLKEELAVKINAPVEEKIMAYENQQLSSALKKQENGTEEKVQLKILEEEIGSLKNKLEERESTSQNLEDKLHRSQSQYNEELKTSKSEILRLEKELESQMSQKDELNAELTALVSASETTKDKVIGLEESCYAAEQEVENLRKEVKDLNTKKEEASTRVNALEKEVGDLKSAFEVLENREQDLLKSQGDMETKLSALNDNLLKSQEKEAELQFSLEEETKKEISKAKEYQEELNSVKSDSDMWQQKYQESEEALRELQGQLSVGKDQLSSKELEASKVFEMLTEKESLIKDLELKVSGQDQEKVDLTEENVKSKEEISQLQSNVKEFQEELNSVRLDSDMWQQKCQESEQALSELQSQLSDRKEQLSSKELEASKALEMLTEKESLIQDLELKVSGQDQEKVDLSEENVKSKEEILQLQSKAKEYQEELNSVRSDSDMWQQKYQESEQALSEIQSQLSDRKEQLSSKELEASKVLEMLAEKESLIGELELKVSGQDQEKADLSEENVKSKEEVSQLQSKLEESRENIAKVQAEMEDIKTVLEAERKEKEAMLVKLDLKEKEVLESHQVKEEIEKQMEELCGQLENKKSYIADLSSKLEDLTSTISDLELRCSESNDAVCKQQHEKSLISESFNKLKVQNQRLEGLTACLAEDIQEKEVVLVGQNTSLLENTAKLNELNECLNERNVTVKALEESNEILVVETEKLKTDHQALRDEGEYLKEQVKKLEEEALMHQQDATQLSLDVKKLQESMTQARQEIDGKSSIIHDLTHDNDIQKKEIIDLKADVEDKECKIEDINSELDALQTALGTSSEERKLLKTNFDACMEDMQQKIADQEAESRRLKSQLAEESRSISEGQNEMKEMYEQQMSQLEDKLSSAEKEKTKLEKNILEAQEKSNLLSESYENQLSDLELNLHAANSECVRLNECIAKVNANFENEIADLKSLHELQRSELLDNNISLEKTIEELKKAVNEKTEKAKVERSDLEQSFEVQMMELDEKRRYSESEVARLKRHLDEMRKDHEKEAQNLEKRYETQLFELEDKCSIMGAELERARKSMMSVEGDFGEERKVLELKVEDLENIRRELEIKISVLDDDLSTLKEQSQRREEEMKSILKNTAERQKSMENEIECLTEELSGVKAEKEVSLNSLKKDYESTIGDLETRNKYLEEKVTSLEIHAEEDMALRNQEPLSPVEDARLRSQLSELKEQNAALSDENISLKRRLLSHKSSDKKILSAGVEDICPALAVESETISHVRPKLLTSTPSKGYESEDSFSPTEVSMIEGFVAERDQPVFSSRSMQSQEEVTIGEPDFVAEEQDRFQPEMVIEKALESSEHGIQQHSIHPIREEEITEGFQPEIGDQFFMETIEEPNSVWPANLSVGKSPTLQEKQQFNFNDIPAPKNDAEKDSNPLQMSDQNSNCNVEQMTRDEPDGEQESVITASEVDRKLADLKERLEEEYVTKMRNQKRDLVVEYECKKDEYQREMQLHLTQRAQSIKSEWEHKFAKALQKVRRDVERRHLKELRQARQRQPVKGGPSNDVQEEQKNSNRGEEGMPDIAEGSEELDERVQQLSRENQELAEARDELLKQIEISQIWGQHHRVQHELQSKISGRDSPASQLSPTKTLTSDSPVVVESPILSASHTPTNSSPAHGDASAASPAQGDSSFAPADDEDVFVEGSDDKVAIAPNSDNISSDVTETESAGEGFLEEFTDISQQSSQDLPLEWELTLTTMDDVGEFERDSHHGSVWEVFDGRCMRQDCQEVRQLYRRLFQFLVKCNVDGEDLLSEESGLVLPSNVEKVDNVNDDNNEGFFSGSNSTVSDIQDVPIDEPLTEASATAFIAALKSEKEQLSSLFNEHLKTDMYEILQENENLRLRLGEEVKLRQLLEKKCNEEMTDVSDKYTNEKLVESIKDLKGADQIDSKENRMSSNDKLKHPPDSDESKHVCDICNQIVQSLNLTLLQKEHAILELTAELSDLKSLKSNGSEQDLGRLSLLRGEIDSLTKEVKFKDRVIKNLRQDLNKLIYPKVSDPNMSHSISSKGELSEKSEITRNNLDVGNLSSSSNASGENSFIKSGCHEGVDKGNSSPLDYTHVEASVVSEGETFDPVIEDVVRTDRVTVTAQPYSGVSEEELAAGEDLAVISHHDMDVATQQRSNLSGEGKEECPVLEGPKLMKEEFFERNASDRSVVSSSSGSTLPSQFNTPEHSRKSTPLGFDLQDKVLAQELNKLRKDLQETRAIYSKENSLLQEALERDRVAKESVDSWSKESDVNFVQQKFISLETNSGQGEIFTEEEMIMLRQRLTICLEQNKMLEEENTALRARIREQDAVVLIVKQKLLEKERSSDEWRNSMNHQLQSLQQQRDDLLQMLRSIEDGSSSSLSEAMGQAALKEESLRQAQENLMEKMEELDHLHQMLTQRQIELQHCEAERHHLEQLCLLKDQTEMQLMKQKRLMEEQVTEIELRLRERETSLVDDKTRLLRELREKDQQLTQMSHSASARSSPTPTSPSFIMPRSSSLGDLNTGLLEALNSSKRHNNSKAPSNASSVDDVDKQHVEAIEKLRHKLKLEYDLRAARMAESQASAIASYWHRHEKSS